MVLGSGLAADLEGGSFTHAADPVASVIYAIEVAGDEVVTRGGTPTVENTWLKGGQADVFEVRYDATGDTPTGDAINTWLAMSQDRDWRLAEGQAGESKIATGTIRIRFIGSTVDLDSAGLSLDASNTG